MPKPPLRIGLIGTGFMGRTHVFGFAAAPRAFDPPFEIDLRAVADRTEELAEGAARALGFARASGDWRRLIDDPEIDVIDITAPNAFHKEMALAAIAAGKHVYCEPLLWLIRPSVCWSRQCAIARDRLGMRRLRAHLSGTAIDRAAFRTPPVIPDRPLRHAQQSRNRALRMPLLQQNCGGARLCGRIWTPADCNGSAGSGLGVTIADVHPAF